MALSQFWTVFVCSTLIKLIAFFPIYNTGMFWREDPTGKIQLTGNDNWPQDDAIIKGEVIFDDDGDKWLKAAKIKQKGVGPWLDVPQGAFMPFKYDDHYYLEAV